MWFGSGSVLLWPSPNSHDQLVIWPVDSSVKLTVSGATPVVGLLALKSADSDAVPVVKVRVCPHSLSPAEFLARALNS
jgi:hypothetical protein